MKLKRVSIKKLFGTLNPDIVFDSGIRIIYGKNGTGKTTILQIINAVLSGSLHELKRIKFQKITCVFDGGYEFTIQKANDNKVPATRRDQFDKKNLLLSLKKSGEEINSSFIKHHDDVSINMPIEIIESEIPELDRIGHREWRNTHTGEFLSLSDIVDTYGHQLPWLSPSYQKGWYKDFISKFKVKFIQTQRLMTYKYNNEPSKFRRREHRTGYENTVTRYSIELRDMLRDKLSESVQISQSLDSTFPNRLLNKDIQLSHNEQSIIELANQLEDVRNSLEASGLISATNVIKIQEGSMSDFDQRAIHLYLNDSLKKYEVFDGLEKKISLFKKILNYKFDGTKTVSFSKENGIEFFTRNGESLNPRLLSSGEQHEVILLYDLIFKTSSDTLVLIDEPEISLHIDWQLSFLSDLESITELTNPQFIIATHSPSIIGNRIDLSQEIVA